MTDTYGAVPSVTPPPTEAPAPSPSYSLKRLPQVREAMSDEEFQTIVSAAIDDAEAFIDDNFADARTRATEYYYAMPIGNEVAGRSSVVMSEVRDVVHMLLPGLMRVFTGQQVVEFQPVGDEDVELAAQATDYIEYVMMRDNPGFQIIYNALCDGLIRKSGIFKWWWEKAEEQSDEAYDNVLPEVAAMIAQDQGVQLTGLEQNPDGTLSIKIRRTKVQGCLRVTTLAPEEFIIARDAIDEDSASLIGHRRDLLVSDLVSMGYDYDVVINNIDTGWLGENQEAQTRNPAITDPSFFSSDKALRKTKYFEVLIRVDRDGDGYAERLKVCAMGDSAKILHVEPAAEVNYAIFCPSPEPHTAIGRSIADEVMDLQRIKSNLMRFTLDGLAQSIVPRTAYDYTSVNADDMVSNEVGANVRCKGPPGDKIMPIASAFPAGDAFSMLQYLDDVKASRTGVSKASQGLDPDVLQQTTATAVNATVSAAEMRQEVIARFFAETLKRVFRGMLKLLHRHFDAPRMIRLRNKVEKIDPRTWNVDMDLTVNVAIGSQNRQERAAVYAAAATKQEQILQQFGPDNPVVDIGQLRNTYVKILALAGERDGAAFFKEVTPEAQAQASQMAAGKAGQDPQTILAQAEMMKGQAEMENAKSKPKLEAAKSMAEDDFKRDELEANTILKCVDIGLKYQINPQGIIVMVFQAMSRNRPEQPIPAQLLLTPLAVGVGSQAQQQPDQGPPGTGPQPSPGPTPGGPPPGGPPPRPNGGGNGMGRGQGLQSGPPLQ
jgi:hypothetical protein